MSVKEKIKELYQDIRENPDAEFEEANFLEGLIKPNGKNIDNSFKGKRYKIKFLHQVQLEFNCCFPNDVFEKQWSMNDFTIFVEERSQKPNVNLDLAQKRLEGSNKTNITPFLFLNAFLLPPAFILPAPWNFAYLLFPMLLNFKLAKLQREDINYYKQLATKIEADT